MIVKLCWYNGYDLGMYSKGPELEYNNNVSAINNKIK